MNKAAVIDLGSNSIRMGIFHTENGKLIQSERYREHVRISEGLTIDECLQKEPMERTLKVVGKFKEILEQKEIKNVKMVATEALRRAKNSDVFVSEVYDKYGIVVEIIDGEKEAEYDVRAACLSVDYNDFYMIDTGGGSMEIALVKDREIIKSCCLPLGSVVMTEKYKPEENGYNELEMFITYELIKSEVTGVEKIPVVALGGSNKEIAKIHGKMAEEIDGYKFPFKEALELYTDLKGMTCEERKLVKWLDAKRADTIVSGLCPLMALCVLSRASEITFSTGSVREGVAADMLL